MADYQQVEVRVFGSSKQTASYDKLGEQQIASTIRDDVLPKMTADYRVVKVKVKRKADNSPDYLVAYLLRKNTYTADVVRINVDQSFQIKDLIENYDDSGEDEDEDDEQPYAAEEYAIDFVAATCETGIPTAVAAVNTVHQLATNAGLNSTKLLGTAANLANYRRYLRSGVKGFVNIGHGFTGGIIVDDGTLSASWFNGLAGDPVAPAVVYFNSCQVFNPPLQPAVMASGARTYIGGIVNLGIGTSEEVCKCFWDRCFKTMKGMRTNLVQCEREKYPTTGAHGISGDTGIFWLSKWFNNKTVIRAHAKHGSQMAWAIVGDSGWLRIKPRTPDGTTNVFMNLCTALANNRRVSVYVDHGQITQSTML